MSRLPQSYHLCRPCISNLALGITGGSFDKAGTFLSCSVPNVAGGRIVAPHRHTIETPHYSNRSDSHPNSFPRPLFILRGMTVEEVNSIGRKSSRFRFGNTAVDSSWLRFRMGLQQR
jgi:hypothetical protein